MPVTAKLSKNFYDRFGDDIVNELVGWFNQVDATYRADLRELNELNFARFDAKLEHRLAEQDARWERRFSQFETKLAEVKNEMELKLADVKSQLTIELGSVKNELLRWIVGLMAPIGLALLGLTITLITIILKR